LDEIIHNHHKDEVLWYKEKGKAGQFERRKSGRSGGEETFKDTWGDISPGNEWKSLSVQVKKDVRIQEKGKWAGKGETDEISCKKCIHENIPTNRKFGKYEESKDSKSNGGN